MQLQTKDKEVVLEDLNVYQNIGMNTNTSNFQHWLNGGLLNDVDETFVTEVQRYWEDTYGKTIDPALHTAFMNLTGKKDTRVIPGRIMRKEILPVFNDFNTSILYKDKNLYDILINPPRSAETVLKNINGTYFDKNNTAIDVESVFRELLNPHFAPV
ncbi:hypothetical protein EPH95_10870 [Salicibibacter halophilus]|uniref:Uncharacterized protein n=1 Tax=Salicibibacter halophilus TaxID=2502791 RepID=A0A514LJA4_9BACI|nr:hypothetical protein [Salicibibacter halophilus]QDI91605.1 hypothetical protein EPH95_10870 [Salicibibacter halophilus]